MTQFHDTNREETLRTQAAARVLGLMPCTLEKWRSQGRGPTYHKIGKRVIYLRTALDEFLQARAVTPGEKCQPS
jgi:hypothetical protein